MSTVRTLELDNMADRRKEKEMMGLVGGLGWGCGAGSTVVMVKAGGSIDLYRFVEPGLSTQEFKLTL